LLTPIIPVTPPPELGLAFCEVEGVLFWPLDQAQLHGIIIRLAQEAAQVRLRHAKLYLLEIRSGDGAAVQQHEEYGNADRHSEKCGQFMRTKPVPWSQHGLHRENDLGKR